MRKLFQELKRRNVYRVAVTYAAVAFVTLQAARLIFPATTLEGLYDKLVVLAFVGFPIALVIAWAFELTPEGIQRTSVEEEAEVPPRRKKSRVAMRALIGLGLVGAAVVGGWSLLGGGGESSPETAASAGTAPTEVGLGNRSIAVLPFETLSPGEDSETFARGIHDDLLARLSNISALKVISRTSVMQYEETDLELPAIADSLGVRWVMEGGVQEMSDQIQVNAQLIDPRTDTHAWAETYRRDLTAQDLFALQTEITKKIARSLEAELTPEETDRVGRRSTEDLQAYRLYVRGRRLLTRRTDESIREATDYFERALERDSTYALAWAGLADARVLRAIYGDELSEERRKGLAGEAMVSARRAWELDSDLAEAWAAMGAIHVYEQRAGWRKGSGPVALQQLRRAVALKPSYTHAQQWLAELYLRLGWPERGLQHATLAVELDPEHAAARQVLIWALVANDRGVEVGPHFQKYSRPHPRLKGLVLYHTGRWDDLEALARERLKRDGDLELRWRFYLARIAALRGDTAAARDHLVRLRKATMYPDVGSVHAVLGEVDAVFSAWERVEDWGPVWERHLRYSFPDVLDPVRDDPRFQALIHEMNRRWGLSPDGSLPASVVVSFDLQADE